MVLGMVISFQITTLEVESMKEVINKLDYINFENICSENDNLHRPWEEGASDREEDGGQAHPPRGSRTADRTRPQLTATGKASAQDARTLRKTQGLWEGGESNTPLDLCCSQGPAMRRRSETQRCCCC